MSPRLIQARNVNHALSDAFWWLKTAGYTNDSRNGPVVVAPGPVLTTYTNPLERVLFNAKRNANPFFHLLESIWMLAGRADATWVEQFNKRMREYAEPYSDTIHGAYGRRWRRHFGIDQLKSAHRLLGRDFKTRRAVIGMWSPEYDLDTSAVDVPCNTHIYLDATLGRLDMTVCCRSNDALWGAYGANAVHFSVLQQVMAEALGLPVGCYHQFSNNLHVYPSVEMAAEFLQSPPAVDDRYATDPRCRVLPMLGEADTLSTFLQECQVFCELDHYDGDNVFLATVAQPMRDYYLHRKEVGALNFLREMPDCDWKLAAIEWHERNVK